jgi:hypothetical protein
MLLDGQCVHGCAACLVCRYERLLEASRHWIREQEFEAAIHKALDNPEPFGFITNMEVRKGF